eukprot:COSAG02_NODE_1051_length_14956_cov_3.414216_5_plen_107_part_00
MGPCEGGRLDEVPQKNANPAKPSHARLRPRPSKTTVNHRETAIMQRFARSTEQSRDPASSLGGLRASPTIPIYLFGYPSRAVGSLVWYTVQIPIRSISLRFRRATF